MSSDSPKESEADTSTGTTSKKASATQGGPTAKLVPCGVCNHRTSAADTSYGFLHREALNDFIREQLPDWRDDQPICHRCLNRFRAAFVANAISQQRGELTKLEEEVIRSLEEQQILSENINTEFEESLTWGQRLADHIATFGGSWAFLLSFLCLMGLWILLNSVKGTSEPFDPYPFILLNLVLSCVAAVQAPIIMMSQNRQEAKDRCRSEHDYLVNLKAEVEIRQLSRKLDQLMSHQWQRLLEIQNIQTELLEELFYGRKSGVVRGHSEISRSENSHHEKSPTVGRRSDKPKQGDGNAD